MGTELSVGLSLEAGGLQLSKDNTQCLVRLRFSLVLLRAWVSWEESPFPPRPAPPPGLAQTQFLQVSKFEAALLFLRTGAHATGEPHLGAPLGLAWSLQLGDVSQPSPGWAPKLFLHSLPWVGQLHQGEHTLWNLSPLPCPAA